MEAANEAARRAVNGILVASGSIAAPVEVWPLQEPEFFAPFREYDRVRFDQGLGWDGGPIELAGSLLDGLDRTHLASLPNSDLVRSDSEPSKIVPALVPTPNSALPRLASHVEQTVAHTVATIASYSVRVLDFNHSNEGPIAKILDGRPVSSHQ